MTIVKPDGMVGLLTPSGIASDKTAARFFKGVSTQGRLRALYDFENRRTRYDAQPFFPDVDSRHSNSVSFVASPSPSETIQARCAFYPPGRIAELDDPGALFPAHGGGFRSRQSKYGYSADLPHPPGCRADDRDLRSPAGPG